MASPRRHSPIDRATDWLARTRGRLVPFLHTVREGMLGHPRWSVFAGLLLATGLVLSLVPSGDRDPEASPSVMVLHLPEIDSQSPPASHEPVPEAPDFDQHAAESELTIPEENWITVEVRPGQTMERIFRDLGLGPGLLHRVVHLDEKTRQLTRIRPGDEFVFDIDPENGFRLLRAEHDEEHWLFIEKNGEGLTSRIEPRELDHRVVEASGTITSSLFNAALAAGLSDNLTMRLANIFGWDIDFALEIRAGDRFTLIYEEIWRDGEFLRDGPILAARFVNQGETFEAIRFDAGNGPDYFAPDGRPMRQAFLRAPLNFTRVTSNFNPRRFHPITRQVRPHNGTDYGAATGTPVWAAGDGRVIRSAYNNRNGNYVFIQHGNNIVTRYLHLSRRDVRQGDRVRQGQTIGAVGATGMATGPHLHYEFLVNGAHRNPRTVDLPPADPLPADLMDDFVNAGRPLLARLNAADPAGLMLARRDDEGCEGHNSSC